MPTTSASSSTNRNRPEDLIGRLSSGHVAQEAKLKALRELKNLIIGNRTKKLAFLKLRAVPVTASILSAAASAGGAHGREFEEQVMIQCAAVIGSFACGLEDGVKAVLEAECFTILMGLVSHPNCKVMEASARSLKLIFQSALAPKFDFSPEKNMAFLVSLLNSENENITSLGASIITHSCQTSTEQHGLTNAGILKKLISLLSGSLLQRESSLEALSAIINENPDVISKFVGPEYGRALNTVVELMKDKNPRTRLLACRLLVVIRNSSTAYLQDTGMKGKLMQIVVELIDDSSHVGDEAPFVLSSLMAEKEDMQRIAFEANVGDKLCGQLDNSLCHVRRLQGTFLALAELCSRLECCRDRVLSLKVMDFVIEGLRHDTPEVRAAACVFLKNVSRSVKNLSAGIFMNEDVMFPMVQLLCDSCNAVQIAALTAICNMVVDFMAHKSIFMQCGGLKHLVHLSKSMDPTIRTNAVLALKNLAFLVNSKSKEEILSELTVSTLTSLVCDPEASVQEQALALVRNLLHGSIDSVEYIYSNDGILLHAIGRQMHSASRVEVLIQGMYVLSNVASGNELHKGAVMDQLFPSSGNETETVLLKFVQSSDSRLRTAAMWALVNLTYPSSPGACGRVMKLRNAGLVSHLKNLVNDSCLDVKLRARMALGHSVIFCDASM